MQIPRDNVVERAPLSEPIPREPEVPAYLRDTYHWAYLSPRGVQILDRPSIVSLILWGNYHRLRRATFAEFASGEAVLQPACVYGNFSIDLARHLGSEGRLDITDISSIQVEMSRRKFRDIPQIKVELADAATVAGASYDSVCCFFLLHEVPDDYKRRIVNRLLSLVGPLGKVVFVDYHRPRPWHPLKPVMATVFRLLEPFADTLWRHEIADFADRPGDFEWSKETYFGALYQKVVARRRGERTRPAATMPMSGPVPLG